MVTTESGPDHHIGVLRRTIIWLVYKTPIMGSGMYPVPREDPP